MHAPSQLGERWHPEEVHASDLLTERALAAGICDLSEILLGFTAYLRSFADSAMRPHTAQLAQLHALAHAASDALQRYRAQLHVALLAPEKPVLLPPQPAVLYVGQNASNVELLRTRCVPLGYGVVACTQVREVQNARWKPVACWPWSYTRLLVYRIVQRGQRHCVSEGSVGHAKRCRSHRRPGCRDAMRGRDRVCAVRTSCARCAR